MKTLTAFAFVACLFASAARGQGSTSDAPSPASPSALEQLLPAHRRMVEQQAPFYRRFPDGSLWTMKIEADRDALPKGTAKLAAYDGDAPFWYCPASDTRKDSEASIFDGLDVADIEAQLGDGVGYFRDGIALYITRDSILLECGSELVLIPLLDANAELSEGDHIPPFAGKRSKQVDYVIPQREPKGFRGRSEALRRARGLFGTADHITVTMVKQLPLAKSRVVHETTPVTSAELASALQAKKLPGLVEWRPIKKQASEPSNGNFQRGAAEHHESQWKWVKTITKPIFSSSSAQAPKP